MRIYVMVGAPGAGKGTQAERLGARLGLVHVASGDLFREVAAQDGPLARQVEQAMAQGRLVPDDVTVRLVLDRLARPDVRDTGAILDGFPRTGPQAEALDTALRKQGARVDQALYVGVREPELRRRLSGRWLCRAAGHPYHVVEHPPRVPGACDIDGSPLYQREDDRPETVQARLEQQLPPMYDVVDHYTERGILTAVDGEQSIDEVTAALVQVIAAVAPAR
ncbi:MAG TPA: nucleoside monophosphate kinase [Candidatus Limnocylindrales bacterium]|nr:nucleoside monophosphate kinase [Candidatus Limnocylindrales bacterium]